MLNKGKRTRLRKWNELLPAVAILGLAVTQLILVNEVYTQKSEIEILRVEVDALMEYPQDGTPYTTPFKPAESDAIQEEQPHTHKDGAPVNEPLFRKIVHGNVSGIKIDSRDWPSVAQTIKDGDGYRKVQLNSLNNKLDEVGSKDDTAYRFRISYTFFGPDGNVIQMTDQFHATKTELSTDKVEINPTEGTLEVITD